jgi:DNA gyrase/topoisomerase IV subunit A
MRKEVTRLNPWYRGFTGNIRIMDKRKIRSGLSLDSFKMEDDSDDDDLIIDGSGVRVEQKYPNRVKDGRYSMITTGTFTMEKDVIVVTELPIGKWTSKYNKWLDSLIEKKLLDDKANHSTDTHVRFELKGFVGEVTEMPAYNESIKLDVKRLQLIKSYGMSNMVLLDRDKKPVKHQSPEAIAREFYEFRLGYYDLRRLNILKGLKDEMDNITGLFKFIYCVIEGQLLLWSNDKQSRDVDDIYRDMDALEIARKHLKSGNHVFTTNKLKTLRTKHEKLAERYRGVEDDTAASMWSRDLDALEAKYISVYKNDRHPEGTRGKGKAIVIGQAPRKPAPEPFIYVED